MQLTKQSRHRKTRGAALVEMAIAMLVLIPLTFGLLEFGWIMYKLSQVNLAARNGVRVAVRPAATTTEVNDAVKAIMDSAGMGDTGYTVVIKGLSDAVGSPVNVHVEVNYSTIELIGLVPTPDFLPGDATMAKEGPST